jgi:hypothetical protein
MMRNQKVLTQQLNHTSEFKYFNTGGYPYHLTNLNHKAVAAAIYNTPGKQMDSKSFVLEAISNTTRQPFLMDKEVPAAKTGQSMRSRKDQILIDEEYTPAADNYPFVTCKSYVVIDADKNKALH